ncbi:MAG: transcriptional regulator, partial [Anaerolineae bacterium]
PDADVTLSLPGKYDKLLYHISAHRWYLGEERSGDVPYEEAVASWYDNAYLPLVQMIREQEIMDSFPGRTEADLYLWLVEHREEFEASFQEEAE